MELSVKSGEESARLEVDTSARALVVKGVTGDQRINLLPDTRIQVVGDRLIVGAREFTPFAGSGRAPTVMDVQEFAKLLRQVAGSSQPSSVTAPVAQRTSPSRTNSLNAEGSLNVEARNHFRRVSWIATFVERAGFIGAILAAVGGLVIAFNRDDNVPDYYSLTERYPFFSEGIFMALFGAFYMLSIAMVAAYIRARAAEKGR